MKIPEETAMFALVLQYFLISLYTRSGKNKLSIFLEGKL